MDGFVKKVETLVERKQYEELRELLSDVDNGPYINKYVTEYVSNFKTLRNVCRDGRCDILHLFVHNGADIYQITENEGSLLEIAAKHGCGSIVSYLLDQGVELSRNVCDPESPFYLASLYGHKEVLRVLMFQSPKLLKDVGVRSTLFYAACLGGNIDVAKMWMSPEMDLNQPAQYVTNLSENMTPLFGACKGNQFGMANFLLSNGAVLTKDVIQAFPEMTAHLMEGKFRECSEKSTDCGPSEDTSRMSTDSDVTYVQHVGKLSASCLEYVHDSWFCSYTHSLVELDLSKNFLKELPETVPWGLPYLKRFDASNNKLKKFLSPVNANYIQCKRIEEINLASNSLNEITIDLFNLVSLKTLVLKDNKLEYLIKIHHHLHDWQSLNENSPIGPATRSLDVNCVSLQYFDVSHNALKLLPDKIRDFTALTYLDVSYNKLSGFCDPWDCPLRTLNLSHNQLERFTTSTEQYWSLYLLSLHLNYNQLDTINEGIVKLASLRELNISHNNIRYLPAPDVWHCQALETLDISFNYLSNAATDQGNSQKGPSFINALRKTPQKSEVRQIELPVTLTRLYDLKLNNNSLNRVPESVCSLLNLKNLDISNNELKRLPKELGRLQNCIDLGIEGLDLINIKPILKEDTLSPDIISYLRQELLECKPCYKIKLVIMGPKGVGKSALANGLLGDERYDTDSMVNKREWSISPGKYKFKGKNKKDCGIAECNSAYRSPAFYATVIQCLGTSLNKNKDPDIKASVWDLSGDKGFTVAQKAFLTSKSVILLVWNLKSDTHGINDLSEWIIAIESYAPATPVILVGTHLDKFQKNIQNEITWKLHQQISKMLEGRENRHSSCAYFFQDVSCLTMEGVGELREMIYKTALERMKSGKIHKVLVPRSYLQLEEEVRTTLANKQANDEPPILKLEEFVHLTEKVKPLDTELFGREFNQAVQFLKEIGLFLHFDDPVHSLNQFYFLDPCWLGDLFHKVLWECFQNITGIAKRGKIEIKSLERFFGKSCRFPAEYFDQYLQIVERFDIALQIDQGHNLFVPSRLPENCPGLQVKDFANSQKIHRFYKMVHIPNGFWSHLVSRILISMERVVQKSWYFGNQRYSGTGLNKTFAIKGSAGSSSSVRHGFQLNKRLLIYWREGIYVSHDNGYFLVEGRNLCNEDEQSDMEFAILITVLSTNGDFSLMGLIVDEIDDILQSCFFDVMAVDERGRLMEIYAVCPACYNISDSQPLPHIEHFSAEQCAGLLQDNKYVSCPKKNATIPLKELVPELLLTELPETFKLDSDKLFWGRILGEGASGTVYFGKYDATPVAIKVYRTSTKPAFSTIDSGSDTMKSMESYVGTMDDDYYNIGDFRPSDDEADNMKALRAFTEMRQEVVLLSRLHHPCVVAMIGLCVQPVLSVVLELAPLGNLRSVIAKKMKSRINAQSKLHRRLLKPVFEKNLTFKILFQLAKALEYIHQSSIINRDLKPDNILVFSLDCEDVINIKVSDYGISRFGASQGTAGFVGTPQYQAPEILAGLVYDEKVDIASFGLITSEVLSGYPPYGDLENLAQITKAVLEDKKKPSMKVYNVETRFPRIESLMDACTEFDPALRPSAYNIARTMKEIQFLCEHSNIKCPDSVPHNIPHVLSSIIQHDSKKKYFWLWETVRGSQSLEEYRAYSIIDSRTCQHNVYKHRLDGPSITCICQVGSTVWIGNEAKQIEILGTQLVGFPNCVGLLHVESVPTDISAVCDGTEKECGGNQNAFVSFEDGSVSLVCPVVKKVLNRANISKSTPMVCNWQETKHLKISQKPIKCLKYLKERKELWAGCENEVVIIDSKLNILNRITIDNLNGNPVVHCLKLFHDTMFCMVENSSKIYQIDMNTYKVIYVFNCVVAKVKSSYPVIAKAVKSEEKTLPSIQNNLDDQSGESSGDNVTGIRKDRATLQEIYTREKEIVMSPPPPIPPRSPIMTKTIVEEPPNLHQQADRLDSSDMPPIPPRKAKASENSEPDEMCNNRPKRQTEDVNRKITIEKYRSSYENVTGTTDSKKVAASLPRNFKMSLGGDETVVTSLCVVQDTLWIGRSCGDILIVNLNESSKSLEYGQIIATLRDFSCEEKGDEGAVIEIIKLGNVVSSFQASDELTCEIKIWEAYTVDEITKIRKFWSSLKSQH